MVYPLREENELSLLWQVEMLVDIRRAIWKMKKMRKK